MDMFGSDSDTTSGGEDDEDINNIGVQDVQLAAEAVESHLHPPAVGRALFARAVSDDNTGAGGGAAQEEGDGADPCAGKRGAGGGAGGGGGGFLAQATEAEEKEAAAAATLRAPARR